MVGPLAKASRGKKVRFALKNPDVRYDSFVRRAAMVPGMVVATVKLLVAHQSGKRVSVGTTAYVCLPPPPHILTLHFHLPFTPLPPP